LDYRLKIQRIELRRPAKPRRSRKEFEMPSKSPFSCASRIRLKEISGEGDPPTAILGGK
jgi:hypothetical protein